METKIQIKTYVIDRICDVCGVGKMRPTGGAYLTYPIKYPHVCTECGVKDTYPVTYPHHVHE